MYSGKAPKRYSTDTVVGWCLTAPKTYHNDTMVGWCLSMVQEPRETETV